MSNDTTANPKVIVEIPQQVLDNALQVTGRNPLLWLKDVIEKTEAARTKGVPKLPVESGFTTLNSREVTIATLVDRIMASMAELVMFQAADPHQATDPQGDSHPDPKTDIINL